MRSELTTSKSVVDYNPLNLKVMDLVDDATDHGNLVYRSTTTTSCRTQTSNEHGLRPKRKLDSPALGGPSSKRPLYEEKMSRTLSGISIRDLAPNSATGCVELAAEYHCCELESMDDELLYPATSSLSSSLDDSSMTMRDDGESENEMGGKVILIEKLRDYINGHSRKVALGLNDTRPDQIYRPLKTGLELVPYVAYLPPPASLLPENEAESAKHDDAQSTQSLLHLSDDIRQRIHEIEEWSEDDMIDDYARDEQIVSYPDSQEENASTLSSKSSSPNSFESRRDAKERIQNEAMEVD